MDDNLLNKAKEIATLLSSNQSLITFKHNELKCQKDAALKTFVTSIGLSFTDDVDRLILNAKDFLDFTPFYCFEEMPKGITKSVFQTSFFIFSKTNSLFSYFDYASKKFIFSDNVTQDFIKLNNQCLYYFRILNSLLNSKFNDHANEANKQLVFYSNANGILKINYTIEPILANITYSDATLVTFENYSTSDIYKTFLINSFYSITKNRDNILSIGEVIEQLEILINTSYRSQELVSKQFDFEKFKDSLLKEKEKFFSSIRDILNKIFSQAIGIPISISAAVFSTYKVSDDAIMLLMVWISFVVYTIFYIRIQWIYRADLKEIENDFKLDFEIIEQKSGLSNEIIQVEKTKVLRKIKDSLSMIHLLIGTVIILGILVSLYIFYELLKGQSPGILEQKLYFGFNFNFRLF